MQQPSRFRVFRDILILPFTVTVIVPYLLSSTGNTLPAPPVIQSLTGILFFISGLSLFIYTVFLFKTIGHGTLAPWSPTQKLVIKGPYAYCRNPMITGVLFMLAGETLFLNSLRLLAWTCIFFLINSLYFILVEEPGLQKRFGDAYAHYKRKVPRWLPSLRPYRDENEPSGTG